MSDVSLGKAIGTLGFQFLRCQVTSVDVANAKATVVDSFGTDRTIAINLLRSPRRPKVGERWMLDRALGPWTFAALIDPPREIDKYVAASPISPASWSVEHGLGTTDVTVALRETASGLVSTWGSLTIVDDTSLVVVLTATHPAGYYTIVVIG